MDKTEFRQRIIVAAIQGMMSNPIQVQSIVRQAMTGDQSETEILAAIAIGVANAVERLEGKDNEEVGPKPPPDTPTPTKLRSYR